MNRRPMFQILKGFFFNFGVFEEERKGGKEGGKKKKRGGGGETAHTGRRLFVQERRPWPPKEGKRGGNSMIQWYLRRATVRTR